MKRYTVGASIPAGNGNHETVEEEVEQSIHNRKELEDVLWNLLDNLGVSTWIDDED